MAETNSFGTFLRNAPTPVVRRVVVLILVGLVFFLGALGTILWILKLHNGPSLTDAVLENSRKLAVHEPMSFQHAYEIKDMSMALMNRKGTRTAYSQFTLIFDCPNEGCKKLLEVNRAKLINAIFEVGGDFYVEDFEAPLAGKGFKRFKEQILNKTKEFFPGQSPKVVVLKDWVMN